jgi:hypothetical protein
VDARFEECVSRLPEHRRKLLLGLSDCGQLQGPGCPAPPGAPAALRRGRVARVIWHTNCLPLGAPDRPSEIWGLFAVTCRANHACKPSARFLWRADLQRELLIAVRPIAAGEEVTVSYSPRHEMQVARAPGQSGGGVPLKVGALAGSVGTFNQARAARQAHLRPQFNFDCGCAACAAPPCEASDQRLFQIGWLLDHVSVIGCANPATALDMCERVLCLMAVEGTDTPADRAAVHSAALELALLAGDEDRAREHVSAALVCTRLCEGATTPSIAVLRGKLRDLRRRQRAQIGIARVLGRERER